MAKFVVDKKDGQFKLNITIARSIYQSLNKKEQEEVDLWLFKNPQMTLNDVITLLYGTLSQRRRTNERLIKGVEEYLAKNKKYHLGVIDIPKNAKYIQVNFNLNRSEYIKFYDTKPTIDSEPIELWEKHISVKNELDEESKLLPSEKDARNVNTIPNNSLWVRIKRFFKQLRRDLFYKKKNNHFQDKKSQINSKSNYKGGGK